MADAQDRPPRDGDGTEAMQRAGRYLGTRPRTEQEVRVKLGRLGYEPTVVDEVIDRLVGLRLVDDEAFARAWVAERSATRGRAGQVLVGELVDKGIAKETAEVAVAQHSPPEEEHAAQVAARLIRKVARLPLHGQGARLHQMLLRRGFSSDAASIGVRAVLPPEGWD